MALDDPTQPIRIHESQLPKDHVLYRPRHSRWQRAALVSAIVFFLIPALGFMVGVRPRQIENHRLAPFPDINDGFGFFTGLSNWATDNLPLRDAGIQAEGAISNGLFGEPPAFAQTDRGGRDSPIGPTSGGSQTPSRRDGFPKVIKGKDGWLYYGYDMQGKCHPIRPLHATISALQRLRKAVEASGRRFVLVVAPDKSTVIPQHLPDTYAGKSCALQYRMRFWQQVTERAGAIDLRPLLHSAERQATRPIYYRQDTHWTDRGAITMLRAIAEALHPGLSRSWRIWPAANGERAADLPPMLGKRGIAHLLTYHLAPDGSHDRAISSGVELRHPYHVQGRRVTGMVPGPVAILGDSFTLPTVRYLPAVFADVTAYYSNTGADNLTTLIRVINHSKAIVLEVVERDLAAGAVPLLQRPVLDEVSADLTRHPVNR